MDWYYVANGQQVGPVSAQDLKALVDAGTVTAETLVWREGMAEWVAQNTVAQEIETEAARHPAGPGPVAPPTERSGLSLKAAPAAAVQQPAAAAQPGGAGTCRECGRQFPLDQMIEYEGSTICAECKPAFFQRLQEGAAISSFRGGTGGQTPNSDIMTYARQNLAARWGLVIGFMILLQLITNAVAFIPIAGIIVVLLCAGALTVGQSTFYLAVVRDADPRIAMMFYGFKRFGTAFLALLLVGIFYFLWALLFLIPGIIAMYRYSMTFYILAEDQDIGALAAIRRSKELMDGNKWKLFCLHLRFAGWMILCMLPMWLSMASGSPVVSMVFLAAGMLAMLLWVQPWAMVAWAQFYDDVLPPA